MNPAGKLIAMGGAAVALGSTFLKYYPGFTYWQIFKRWDVATAVLCGAVIVLAIIALTNRSYFATAATALLSLAIAGNFVSFLAEAQHGTPVGAYIGGVGGIVAAVGGIVIFATDLMLRAPSLAQPQAVSAFGAPAQPLAAYPPPAFGAVAPQPAPVPVPAPQPVAPAEGWYPDPHVPGQQRYWDGRDWTDHTHGG